MSVKKAGLPLLAAILCFITLVACTSNEQVANDNGSQQAEQQTTEKQKNNSDQSNNETSQKNDSKQKDDDNQNESNKQKNESQHQNEENTDKKNTNTPEDDNISSENQNSSVNDKRMLPDGTLTKGDRANKVNMIQSAFNKMGYSLQEDSVIGPGTAWAVKDYQAQQSGLTVGGVYGPGTRESIKKAINGQLNITPGSGISKEKINEEQTEDKQDHNQDTNQDQNNVISDPSSILALVNKSHELPAGYVPDNLVIPDVRFPFDADLPKKQMRRSAANALEKMFAAGDKAGIDLFAQSGYRSYDRQEAIFASNVREHGKETANQFSAQAGESEHQTGLTMDVTSADIGFKLTTEFANTDEGQWVKQHASEYGFIIRYPKGKTSITGYQYEPWHLRYVGKSARAIDVQNITLEKFLGVQ